MHRILIVSAEEPLRELLRLSLAAPRTEVRCVASCEEMRRSVARLLFDVVLVVGLAPFLVDGDLVRTLRPKGLRRPRIYVLAWQQAEELVLGLLESGVDQYLTLPVSLGRLRMKVAEALCM